MRASELGICFVVGLPSVAWCIRVIVVLHRWKDLWMSRGIWFLQYPWAIYIFGYEWTVERLFLGIGSVLDR